MTSSMNHTNLEETEEKIPLIYPTPPEEEGDEEDEEYDDDVIIVED